MLSRGIECVTKINNDLGGIDDIQNALKINNHH